MLSLCHNIIPIISWVHNVLSAQSLVEAVVDFLPAPNVVNDNQELAEEAGEGGRDHYNGPYSMHFTWEVLLWAREVHSLFCEDDRKEK